MQQIDFTHCPIVDMEGLDAALGGPLPSPPPAREGLGSPISISESDSLRSGVQSGGGGVDIDQFLELHKRRSSEGRAPPDFLAQMRIARAKPKSR